MPRILLSLQHYVVRQVIHAGATCLQMWVPMLKTVNICFKFPASYLAGSILFFYCIYSGCSIKQGTGRLISSSYFVNRSYNMALAYLSFFLSKQITCIFSSHLIHFFLLKFFWQLDEWWEQPASTVVDWITVDGQNVAAWHNHVKQLLTFYDKELL